MSSSGGTAKLRFEYWPLTWMWPLSLVLAQVTFAQAGDFAITLSVISCHLIQLYVLMFYWLRRPPSWQIVAAGVVLTYTLWLGLFAWDLGGFAGSLAHIVNLTIMTLLCLNARVRAWRAVRQSIAIFCCLAAIMGGLIVAQALSFNLWRDFTLASPLGGFAPLGPGEQIYLPLVQTALPRAHGAYSEPSVAGWFMSFAVAIALAARPVLPALATLTAALCAAGAIATLSLTGILGVAIVMVAYLAFVRDDWRFKLGWTVVAGAALTTALVQAYQLGILARFEHVDSPGTSIYFRLTAPLRLISESLEKFPWGYPVGQVDFIASRDYYVNWEFGSQTNIDNTLLMIVFYFGLLGLVFNFTYVVKLGQYLVLRRRAVGLILLSLFVALNTTGAGWAHHFVLMLGYAIFVGRYLNARRLLVLAVAPIPQPRAATPLPPAARAPVPAMWPGVRPHAP